MARRPLPRILSNGSASIARSREMARTAADSATDVLHPLITITRGLRRLVAAGRRRWVETPKDRRGPLLFLVGAVVLVMVFLPYGPLLAFVTLMAAAAWKGRDPKQEEPSGPDESQVQRLSSLYEALVPYFSVPEDPSPLYAHGGEWEQAFEAYDFDGDGRFGRLSIRYPAYFTDGEAESRARIEQLLNAKLGRGREYHFGWDEEANHLTVTVLAPLPTDIAAQRFVTSPGETVLGFTDETGVQRTLPVMDGEEQRDVPPVVWRTGIRSTEPHLLVVGQPGSGTSSLLRSIALQALQHGDVLVIEGSGTGDYACLVGRPGVLTVESGLGGALASLEWAAHETERRLIAANRARQAGHPAPDDIKRPLWILLDRPTALGHLAAADGRTDPQTLLQVPLRHGRAAGVTVAVAEQFDALPALDEAVGQHTRARVVLGPATPAELRDVLGALPRTTPTSDVPPGRGYARLGTGEVHRLQVPATPDPYDDATSEAHRQAVIALLPDRATPDAPAPAQPEPAPTTPASATQTSTTRAPATQSAPQAAATQASTPRAPATQASAPRAAATPTSAAAAPPAAVPTENVPPGSAPAEPVPADAADGTPEATRPEAPARGAAPAEALTQETTPAGAHTPGTAATGVGTSGTTPAQTHTPGTAPAETRTPGSVRAAAHTQGTGPATVQTPETGSVTARAPETGPADSHTSGRARARARTPEAVPAGARAPETASAATRTPGATPADDRTPATAATAPKNDRTPATTPADAPKQQSLPAETRTLTPDATPADTPEAVPSEGRPPEAAPADDRTPDMVPASSRTPETVPADDRSPDTVPANTRTPVTASADTRTPEPVRAETLTPETIPADTPTPETALADTRTPETIPADTRTPETVPPGAEAQAQTQAQTLAER